MHTLPPSDAVTRDRRELPRLVVTGASGFLGRRLLEQARPFYRIEAVDLRSQGETDAPLHPNIHWHQADLGDPQQVADLFRRFRDTGGADYLVHLAAYYDFTGEDHPEYTRTNVDGLRHVLEASAPLGLQRLVFASSLAACRFPAPGEALDESSPADGDHPYAVSKRRGEELLAEHGDRVPCCVVRLAALFSDWCEYPPLYVFLGTWLSRRWNARLLGGRGRSAVPYLHVRDAAHLLLRVLERHPDLGAGEVLLASPDGAVSHEELYDAATAYHYGSPRHPIHVPKPLATVGMWGRDLLGRLLGERPFERPWMARYIDRRLTADARRTRSRLGWRPRSRLEVLHRIPFLLENMKADPVEWQRRNQAMRLRELRPNLGIYGLLAAHEDEITEAFTAALTSSEGQESLPHYHRISERDHHWHHRLILRNLINAVRTREKGLFMAYCRDLGEHRFHQGFSLEELEHALRTLERLCIETLSLDPEARGWTLADLQDAISTTIDFGLDQIEEVYEVLGAGLGAPPPRDRTGRRRTDPRGTPAPVPAGSLEEPEETEPSG